MWLRKAIIASTAFLGCSGAAGAMSAMPMGNGDPLPTILAFFTLVAFFTAGYIISDWLTRRDIDRMKRDHDIDGLVRSLKNGWLACRSARALGEFRDEKAVEPLIEALHDSNSDVRRTAAKALGDIGDSRAIGPLTLALGDEYRSVRDCASHALKKLQIPGNSF